MKLFDIKMIALALTSLLALACNSTEVMDTTSMIGPKDTVNMGVTPIVFDDVTKTEADLDESTGLSFTWSDGDAVGVYSAQGGFSRFTLSAGAGTGLATFDGQGFSLTPGATYYAAYPYNGSHTSATAVPVSYDGRSVSGDACLDDILDFDPLYASAVVDDGGRAHFEFEHVSSFARIKAEMPAAGTFSRLKLIPTYEGFDTSGKLDITDGTWAGADEEVAVELPLTGISASRAGDVATMWVPLAPQDMRGDDVAAVMYGSDGHMYTSRLAGYNFRPGKAYRWDTEMVEYSCTGSSDISVSNFKEVTLSSLPSGQYSGITRLSNNTYAVVHDSETGGGIYFVDISISKQGGGNVMASYTIPAGTSSGGASRDAEGIAYFPKAGTLFVSGEADQSILEYGLDGYPTGRRLEVPADMSTSSIYSNSGFEALTYNETTGKFWTTTEDCLRKDLDLAEGGGSLLRLQSFNDDLSAGERYFYLMDAPSYSASTARNYAYGVSDMLALDDGRLIIMEREAYIPSGNYMDILFNTVVFITLYEVDPVHDHGGILSKRLVKGFSITGATNFANYEGMCLGPEVNGEQTLLLISDSQDRYQGVLSDWLKVMYIDL